ncbi:hypothetical protein OROGR_018073 [Orobanche gracilis]
MYHSQNNSFSMLFSMANNGPRDFDEDGDMYSTTTPPPAAPVDCTLSLGTPSTRVSNDHHENKHSSCMSNFGWNILPSKHTPPPPPPSASKSHRGRSNGGGDPLLARRCANCDTTSTPLWRNGPRGPKSLCNACGIRFKKEERRATAAAASGPAHGSYADTQNMVSGSHPWDQPQKTTCYSSAYGNEYRFIDDDVAHHRDSETMQFPSWRFNVADRPGLLHDFTT